MGVRDVLASEATCLFFATSGLLVSDVMAIVVEGEQRSPRRDLFCVHVGVESSCALLIALVFFVDPSYLMLRDTQWLSNSSGRQTFKEHQGTSQLRPLSGLTFPSCVLTYTGSTLLNNTFQIFDSTSFGRDDGFPERSDVAVLQLLFGLNFVPHHTSEFLAMDTPITRFSSDQFTCTLSKRLRLPQSHPSAVSAVC